jgi:hypothetical protein
VRHRCAFFLASFVLSLACAAQSAPMMSAATAGVGPHGYDFLIGTWTCKNSMPSPMGGPAITTAVISRSGATLAFHATGTNFGAMGYVVYAPKTKTWWNPSVSSSGGYGTESSSQTGKKVVFAGPFTDPSSGKTAQVRDTYTWVSATTYTDLFQVDEGGTWKTEGNSTCTRS